MIIQPEPAPFGFCTDHGSFLIIVTHNQLNRISRLKLHIDGIPEESRKHDEMLIDLPEKLHNVVNEPIISWT